MIIYKAENKINGKSYIGQTSLSFEEEKNKRNAAVRIACSLPEYRSNMSRIIKERWANPEYRERLRLSQREAAKKRWSDPEYRMKVLTAKGYI